MDCQNAREGLWPPERPRLLGKDVSRARAHVEACEECQAYFAQDRALLDAYDRARRQPAPLVVREAVFDALARARFAAAGEAKRPRRGLQAAVGVAGLTAVSVLAGLVLADFGAQRAAPSADPGIFAEDYLRRAVGEDHVVTSDPLEVRRFLQRELGMGLEPLQHAGLLLEGAEVCLIQGRRGAMVVYKMDGATISHYLVPSEEARRRAPAVAEYRNTPTGGKMPIVVWSTPRLEQALIGDVDADELLRIAQAGLS